MSSGIIKWAVDYFVGDWDSADTVGIVMAGKVIAIYLVFNIDWS